MWPRTSRIGRWRRPAALIAPALALALLLSGCTASQPQNTFGSESDVARMIQDLFVFIIAAAAVVFVVVEGILLYTVLRFRRRPGDVPGPPVGRHGHTRLEVIWTLIPVAILVVVAVPTTIVIFDTARAAPPSAVQVEAIGHQWWFEFRYPRLHIVTADELHLPVGQTANIALGSADVIHSFWVPRLAGKRDMFPNHANNLWFTPRSTGVFMAQCAEFCGESHAFMRMRVVVQSQRDFDAWVRDQQAPARPPTTAAARAGARIFAQSSCVGCHTIAGTNAKGTIGPNLTHVGSRATIAAEVLDNTPANLAHWIQNSASFKPGSHMPPQSIKGQNLQNLIAYLQSLK